MTMDSQGDGTWRPSVGAPPSRTNLVPAPATPGLGLSAATEPREYAYARGLDYLRRAGAEHELLSALLMRHWAPTSAGTPVTSPRFCDYGSGFGDLTSSLLGMTLREGLPRTCAVDLVDPDERLRDYAKQRVAREGTQNVRAFSGSPRVIVGEVRRSSVRVGA